ncbi:MAG: ABC transporter ATP-binding protein [Cyanobacteria bacterium J06626_23]
MRKYLHKVFFILSNQRRAQLALLILASILASILEAFGVGLIGPFLALVSDPTLLQSVPALAALAQTLGLSSPSSVVVAAGVAVIALFCFKAIAYSVCKFLIYQFGYQQKRLIESRLLHTYLNIPYIFHLDHNTAEFIERITIESDQFTTNSLIPLLEIVANLFVMILLIALLAYTDLSLLVISMAILLPAIFLFASCRHWVQAWGQQRSKNVQEMIREINHGLGGLKETKVIGCEPFFQKRLDRSAQSFARAATYTNTFHILPKVFIETVLVIFLLVYIVGTTLLSDRSLDELVAVLGVFAVATIRLLPSISQSLNNFGRMCESSYAVDMLYHDLREIERYGIPANRWNPSVLELPSAYSLVRQQSFQTIQLDRLTYRYPDAARAAIRDMTLTLRRGEAVAFIGRSGAGKTTLVDVLLGLLSPESGDILLDGVSIYKDMDRWRQMLGYIPQSIFLLDDTIEHNIAFGVPHEEIDPGRLRTAIQAAQLSELLDSLPEGIHTRVGERGVKLSGGQRQRIGIARALYHEREILVLDEATSALDNETEQMITEAINVLAGSKTLIIIAHRLSTIEHCDRVYLLEQGEVKQYGSFQEVVGARV